MEATIRKRKTVVLTKDEFATLKAYASKYNTLVECAEAIGIHRNVLDRVMIVKRGSVDTTTKIKAAIGVNDNTEKPLLQATA